MTHSIVGERESKFIDAAFSQKVACVHAPFSQSFGATNVALLGSLVDATPHATLQESKLSARSQQGRKLPKHRRDQIDYCIIFAFAFVIMLWAAIIQRCLPRKLRSYPSDPSGRKSIFAEASGAARDIMPFAFMG